MDHHINVSADWTGEMAVVLEAQSIVDNVIWRVAGEAHAFDVTGGQIAGMVRPFDLKKESLDILWGGYVGEGITKGNCEGRKVPQRLFSRLIVDTV